jgi:hypothetical protein
MHKQITMEGFRAIFQQANTAAKPTLYFFSPCNLANADAIEPC